MLGLMQDWPLTLDRIIDHGARNHGHREIVTRSIEGPLVRTTYADLRRRARQGSHGLAELGIKPGDRVATLAWNTHRHVELWYAAMGMGAVCHTLNPRLHPDQICWIIRHAGDKVIFADLTFAPLLMARRADMTTVEKIVLLSDEGHRPADAGPDVIMYEEWLAGRPHEGEDAPAWGGFDERTAAGLCYTSGTTGDPKGVLYSHRSNFLHTLLAMQGDAMGISSRDTVLAVVPMFHANAWGLPFTAPAVGAKLVLPGMKLDGASVHELLETEGVTFSAAVPTVWQMLLQHLRETGGRISTLKTVIIGGSACPGALIRAFHDDYGVEVLHAWGMTETSPLGTVGSLSPEIAALPFDQQMEWRLKQGRPPLGIELQVRGPDGRLQPEDGVSQGRLTVRGPTIASAYFGGKAGDALDPLGEFDTGDIATIDPQGYMRITDRAKDVIKSGGEWISSIDIENLIVGHPAVALAAVIGMPHPKWDERPMLVVQLKPGASATAQDLLAFLDGKIAKWWMPDEVAFVETVPLGPTGKIDKKALRAQFFEQSASAA
jgi:fatty-acyl-CoA synthase